jgi:hypothetical protein
MTALVVLALNLPSLSTLALGSRRSRLWPV